MKRYKLLLISVLIAGFLMLTPAITSVMASPNKIKINECKGMGVLVSKWEWNGASYIEDESNPDYNLIVTGDAEEAYWTAEQAIDGVVSKEATERHTWPGGLSGTITKNTVHDISHISFCAETVVPEFNLIGGIIVFIGTVSMILIKRN